MNTIKEEKKIQEYFDFIYNTYMNNRSPKFLKLISEEVSSNLERIKNHYEKEKNQKELVFGVFSLMSEIENIIFEDLKNFIFQNPFSETNEDPIEDKNKSNFASACFIKQIQRKKFKSNSTPRMPDEVSFFCCEILILSLFF